MEAAETPTPLEIVIGIKNLKLNEIKNLEKYIDLMKIKKL